MKAKATLLLPLSILLAGMLGGCVTPVAIDTNNDEDQNAYYQAGFFYAPINDGNVKSIFRTAIRVMDDMGYYRTGELHRENKITIFARKEGDREVTVRISKVEEGQSEIRIGIGMFGNLSESQRLYSRIREAH
ncbi:MAG: DUF3568 family protein [Opitutales bacterium]